jgi:hypothetical protein
LILHVVLLFFSVTCQPSAPTSQGFAATPPTLTTLFSHKLIKEHPLPWLSACSHLSIIFNSLLWWPFVLCSFYKRAADHGLFPQLFRLVAKFGPPNAHMMSSAGEKRKHESDRSKPARLRKRQKSVKYLETHHSNHSGEGQVWQARAILEEKVIKGKKYYLIDWEGIDPATGQKYEPSWGDKPTKPLLKDWQQKRKSRGSHSPSLVIDEPKPETKRHERLRRVIDRRGFSKSTSPLQSAAVSTRTNSLVFSGEESSPAQTASPQFESNHSDQVEIQQSLKTDFDSADYLAVSSQLHRHTPLSNPLRQSYEPDAVIPDSQPSSPETLPSDRNLPVPGEILDVQVS